MRNQIMNLSLLGMWVLLTETEYQQSGALQNTSSSCNCWQSQRVWRQKAELQDEFYWMFGWISAWIQQIICVILQEEKLD